MFLEGTMDSIIISIIIIINLVMIEEQPLNEI